MWRRKVLTLVLSAVILIGLVATSSFAQGGKKFVVGYTSGHTGHSMLSRVWRAAVERGKELGIDMIVMDAHQWDLGVESSNIDQFIARKVDGIILDSSSADGSAAAAKRAMDKGIPVISLWNDANGTPYIGSNFVGNGGSDLQGKAVVDALHGKGNVIYIKGTAAANSTRVRDKGISGALAPFPNIKIIYENFSDWQRTGGEEQMNAALAKFPAKGQINAVIAMNDDMGLGALEAVKRTGRLNDPIMIFGIDGNPAFMEKIVSGELVSTVYQNAELAGWRGAEIMYLVLTSKQVPNKQPRPDGPWQVAIPWEMITKDNASQWLVRWDSAAGMMKLPDNLKWDVLNMK